MILDMAKAYLSDKGIWVMVATYLGHLAANYVGASSNAQAFVDVAVAVVGFLVAHFAHRNTVGANNEPAKPSA